MHIVDLARAGELSLVEQALHKGEGVNSRCFRNGSTPLIAAAFEGHTDIAIALLKAKANINATNNVRAGLAGWMVVCVQRLSTLWG